MKKMLILGILVIFGIFLVSQFTSAVNWDIPSVSEDTDTWWDIVVKYLYNNSGSLDINETKLNATIDARDTDTTYTAGSGITLTGTEFNHTDTSSQASSDNSGRTYIQDIILDTFGHITSIVTATETVTDTNTWWTIFSQDFINDSNTLKLNWTTINDTIDARDTDTTIGNCSIAGSCSDIGYMNYANSGNFTVDGNITGLKFCNSTNCYDVSEFFDDTDTTIGNCSAEGSCTLITYDSELSYIGNCSADQSCSAILYDTNASDWVSVDGDVISDLNITGELRVTGYSYMNDTLYLYINGYDQFLYFYRDGGALGYIDNSNSNVRIKAANDHSIVLVSDSDWGMTIDDNGDATFTNDTIVTGNVTAYAFCNTTNCYTIDELLSGTDTWWAIKSADFINNSNTLELNWTTINDTIDARDTTIGNCSADQSCPTILYDTNASDFMAAGTDNWVNESGDTMTGNLNMSDNNITDVDFLGVGLSSPLSPIHVYRSQDYTSGEKRGIYSEFEVIPSGASSGYGYAARFSAQHNSGLYFNELYGFRADVLQENTGTINKATGGYFVVRPMSTGTINDGYGIRVYPYIDNAGGTITDFYGVYVEDKGGAGSITNQYAIVTEAGDVIFNEDSTDSDFRVESNQSENMLFVDASTDRVGIGTATPGYTLDVNGAIHGNDYYSGDGSQGWTGTFSLEDLNAGAVVTVKDGLITDVSVP